MNVPKKLLEILSCPKRNCRGDLTASADNLECLTCGDLYPAVDNIPILFPNSNYAPDINRRHWDQEIHAKSYAQKYDSYMKKQGSAWGLYTHISEIEAIRRLTRGKNLSGRTVLDVGCGNGRLLSEYKEAGTKIGLDTSLQLLQAAKKREPGFWLVCGQAEDLPFKDAIADLSVSVRVFQHLQTPEQAFSEMVRVTKPSGYVALENYNKFNLKELYKRIRMIPALNEIWPWGLNYDAYHSYCDIQNWCDQTFIKPIKYTGAGWGINFYLLELLRFRRFAPEAVQKTLYKIYLGLEHLLADWPVFRVTMEKICFIGSVQYQSTKYSPLEKLTFRIKARITKIKIGNFQTRLQNRNYALVGSDEMHLANSIKWLKRAQDATPDAGVSRAFSLGLNRKANRFGWQPSYPETTGYIIPTLFEASQLLGDPDLARRARLMADWELNITFPDGGVHGGNIAEPSSPAIFDTGQVIRGMLATHKHSGQNKYLEAAKKSAQWILSREYKASGSWQDSNALSVNQDSTTYNIYAAVPVVMLGKEIANHEFAKLGQRVGDYTLLQQRENGWFANCDFRKKDQPLLHTLAYTIDGLWDMGDILKQEKFSSAATLTLDAVLRQMDERGNILGRFNKHWSPTVNWSCLTGIAQIGVTCMKVYKKTGDKKYFEKARLAKEFLKTCQNNLDDGWGGGRGALWGSWPISGDYGQYQALNWAAKYFADLLTLCLKTK